MKAVLLATVLCLFSINCTSIGMGPATTDAPVDAGVSVATDALCTIEDQQAGQCPDSNPPLPACAAIGCPFAPSGTGDMSRPWEPCFSSVCYCRSADGASLVACTP
jgi:hypothetical protein